MGLTRQGRYSSSMILIKRWWFGLLLLPVLALLLHGWLEMRIGRAWQAFEADVVRSGLALQIEQSPQLVWRPVPHVMARGLVLGPADGGLPWVRVERLLWAPNLQQLLIGDAESSGELLLSGLRGRLPSSEPDGVLLMGLLHQLSGHPAPGMPQRVRIESLDLSLGDASGLRLDGAQAQVEMGRWTLSGALRQPGRLDLSIQTDASRDGQQWRIRVLAVGRQTAPSWSIDWQRINLELVGQAAARGWLWSTIESDARFDLRLPAGDLLSLDSRLALRDLLHRPDGMSLGAASALLTPRREAARLGASWKMDMNWSAAERRFSATRVDFDAGGNEAARQVLSDQGLHLSRGGFVQVLPLRRMNWVPGRELQADFGDPTARLRLVLSRSGLGWAAQVTGRGLDFRTLPPGSPSMARLNDPLSLMSGLLFTWPDGAETPLSLSLDLGAVTEVSHRWERLQLKAALDRRALRIDRLHLQDARWAQTWQARLGLQTGRLELATQLRARGGSAVVADLGPVRGFQLQARLQAQGMDSRRWLDDLTGRPQVNWRGATAGQRSAWASAWLTDWRSGARFPWEPAPPDAR